MVIRSFIYLIHIYQILNFVAEVTVVQHFLRFNKKPLEASYVFPIDDTASAVVGFEMTIDGDNKVIGRVKEKDEAFNEYDDSIAKGKSASLLEKNTRDTFKLSLGSFHIYM